MPAHRTRLGLLVLATALAGLPPAPALAAPTAPAPRVLKDRYIVQFERNTPKKERDAEKEKAKGKGGKVHFEYDAAVQGFAATLPAKAVEALRKNPHVIAIEPDTTVEATETQPSPPSWGLDRIDQGALPLDRSFTFGATGLGVTAYVIDSGVRSTHTDLAGRVTPGYTAVGDGRGTEDCAGHGTHVAGTIGGTRYGVAKDVDIVAVRVLDCTGGGTMSGVVAGVDWVAAHAVPGAVANMSLGGDPSDVLDDAIAHAIAGGTTFVVAAGNDTVDACDVSPARTPAAITVGASTATDARASFSNFGPCVDLFAPGDGITSAWSTSDTATKTISGTSMATPHVTGVVAAYLERAPRPAPAPATVADTLLATATRNRLTGLGSGSPNRLLHTMPASTAQPANAPPVATAPTLSLPPLGSTINTSSVPVRVSWSASDPDGTVAGYQLEQSTNGGTSWTAVALPSRTATSLTVHLATVTNRAYRVRATDDKGLTGAYATGPVFGLTLSQESAASYTGTWSALSISGAYGGSVRRTAAKDATATYSFTGSQIAWLATAAATRGYADVLVDGVSQGIYDLYAPSTIPRLVAFTARVPAGPHKLQIRALGARGSAASNTYVDVDGFVVLR